MQAGKFVKFNHIHPALSHLDTNDCGRRRLRATSTWVGYASRRAWSAAPGGPGITGDRQYANPAQMHGRPRLVSRKEPVLRLPPAPVETEQLQELRREQDLARIFALAIPDVHHHPLAVDIRG